MTKLERVTGITLLTALICVIDVGIFAHVYERVSTVINALAMALGT